MIFSDLAVCPQPSASLPSLQRTSPSKMHQPFFPPQTRPLMIPHSLSSSINLKSRALAHELRGYCPPLQTQPVVLPMSVTISLSSVFSKQTCKKQRQVYSMRMVATLPLNYGRGAWLTIFGRSPWFISFMGQDSALFIRSS